MVYNSIYVSHFLTSWSDRLYEFASYLFIIDIFKQSLLLPSIYGFTVTVCAILFSNYVGRYVDSTDRLKMVRVTMVTQKVSIVASCSMFIWMNLFEDYKIVKYSFVVLFGCTLKLSFIANNIAIEKDWVMVISNGHPENLTTSMRRIDLFCKTMAPLTMGFITSQRSLYAMIIWNILSGCIEYILVYKTYLNYPELSKNIVNEYTPLVDEEDVTFMGYVKHRVFLASLSLSMLYLTVLSFGGIMVSYLKLIGYSDFMLGVLRVVAGIAGISATYLMPMISSRIGVIRTGIWSLWAEFFTLVPVVLSFKLNTSHWIKFMMMFGGMSLSRIGLWMFDLSETLILQQFVDPKIIGGISGWQHAMCNFFDLLQFILTIIVSNPEDFFIPSIISLLAVLCSSLIFSYFVFKERGHLLHLKCL
jgi:iron-regulated transporter 1